MIFRILEDQMRQKSEASKEVDRRFMQLALTLGRRGLGRTWPNPAVGAVVVKDGVIVGRGWTQPGGRPHAEPEALRRAGEAEISSETIGEIVMEHLRTLDDVAYVRFASVYRNFGEVKDFRAALDELSGDDVTTAKK